MACDFGTDRFFSNNGDGTFTDVTKAAIGIDTKKGMNVDWGDYDNDGPLDVYVTNITDDYMREGNFLWRNNGDRTFTDVARETGTHDTGWGWAGKFFDYDNDGWLDLYVVNGWVSAGQESYVPDIFEMITQPNVDFADARNWPPMGNKSLSGYQKKRLFHNQRRAALQGRGGAPRPRLDARRPRHRGRGLRQRRPARPVRRQRQRRALSLPQHPADRRRAGRRSLLAGTESNRDAVGAQARRHGRRPDAAALRRRRQRLRRAEQPARPLRAWRQPR